MATASEIKITEAYIGLLGRAPDPAGLAYWVGEYDAAVAAGGDPDTTLKKITNDFTLNKEWADGTIGTLTNTSDGSVKGDTDAAKQTNADSIVNQIYQNQREQIPPRRLPELLPRRLPEPSPKKAPRASVRRHSTPTS